MLRAADLFLDADVPIEAAPSKHAVAQGMFLYVYEPGGNRVEVTTGTHFIYVPDYETVVWSQAERARGQAWGVRTIDTLPHLRHPRRSRHGRAADSADEPDPAARRSRVSDGAAATAVSPGEVAAPAPNGRASRSS